MTIDWTKPIETMDGRPARVLATDLKNDVYPVAVVVAYGENVSVWMYTREGRLSTLQPSPSDLRNVQPQKFQHVRYVNVYNDFLGHFCLTRADADCAGQLGNPRIACVRVVIEGEKGQYDD